MITHHVACRWTAALALCATLVAPPVAAYHLTDALRGTTAGHPVGGSFAADGWHVTSRTDRIWYEVPRLVTGSIEFTLTGLTMDRLGDVDNEIAAIYEAGFGIAEPVRYSPEFRNNHYKGLLRVYGNSETGREGWQKLIWEMCPSGAPGYDACGCASFASEPFGNSGPWDGSAQRMRIEWNGSSARYLRNGRVVVSVDWGSTGLSFGPSSLHMSLGTSRPAAVDTAQLPVGVVFSDVVIDGVEGAEAVCPGAPRDAGVADVVTVSDAGASTVIESPAVEDVTVDPMHATTVFPDVNDLSVGAGDSEFYVKFRVGSLPGRVVRAQLILNSATIPSAVGTGASVYAAASASWSETSLTWNARPGPTGPRLARVDGISVNERYTLELPAGAVTAPGVYAFAVLPEATDTNAAHFDAKEVSAARGPVLRLVVDPTMPIPSDAGVVPPDVTVARDVVTTADVVVTTDVVVATDVPVARDAVTRTDVTQRLDVAPATDAAEPDARAPDADDTPVQINPSGGCGCRARTSPVDPRGVAALAAVALGLRRRRRR